MCKDFSQWNKQENTPHHSCRWSDWVRGTTDQFLGLLWIKKTKKGELLAYFRLLAIDNLPRKSHLFNLYHFGVAVTMPPTFCRSFLHWKKVQDIHVDGDLDESIKRSASDRLGDLVPQVRARTSPGVFRNMALLGLCLELSFSVLYCRTQANLPSLDLFCHHCPVWPLSPSPLKQTIQPTSIWTLFVWVEWFALFARWGREGLLVVRWLLYIFSRACTHLGWTWLSASLNLIVHSTLVKVVLITLCMYKNVWRSPSVWTQRYSPGKMQARPASIRMSCFFMLLLAYKVNCRLSRFGDAVTFWHFFTDCHNGGKNSSSS